MNLSETSFTSDSNTNARASPIMPAWTSSSAICLGVSPAVTWNATLVESAASTGCVSLVPSSERTISAMKGSLRAVGFSAAQFARLLDTIGLATK